MKISKILMLFVGLSFSHVIFCQSDVYILAMRDAIGKLKADSTGLNLVATSAQFERIALAVRDNWVPYYYASYTNVLRSFPEKDPAIKDHLLDHAKELLDTSFKLKGDSDELFVIQGFIYLGKLSVEPQTRSASYIQLASACFKKAIEFNASNPRAYYMQGTSVFYTPEFYGGGKQRAKPLLLLAMQKFHSFVPSNEFSPDWGSTACKKLLDSCQ